MLPETLTLEPDARLTSLPGLDVTVMLPSCPRDTLLEPSTARSSTADALRPAGTWGKLETPTNAKASLRSCVRYSAGS